MPAACAASAISAPRAISTVISAGLKCAFCVAIGIPQTPDDRQQTPDRSQSLSSVVCDLSSLIQTMPRSRASRSRRLRLRAASTRLDAPRRDQRSSASPRARLHVRGIASRSADRCNRGSALRRSKCFATHRGWWCSFPDLLSRQRNTHHVSRVACSVKTTALV